jgi:hypothetical protein
VIRRRRSGTGKGKETSEATCAFPGLLLGTGARRARSTIAKRASLVIAIPADRGRLLRQLAANRKMDNARKTILGVYAYAA